VLDGVGLNAGPGEVVGLIGPNGSGKTTLLRVLYAALRPRAGFVSIDDDPVAEMVLLGRSPHPSAFQRYTAADHRTAATGLRRVGVRQLADRAFGTLSGGEKQRVLVARALAQESDHLLLDEPANHLDIRYQHEILGLVRALAVTTVVVLHDLNLAARYCDHLVLLDRGAIARAGSTDQVLTPEVLEPVYGIGVRRLIQPDCVQLVFHPLESREEVVR
jgi:iron complex transport system ATP-binding protein